MAGEVTIRLKGGLGNQLFMYFAGANLAKNLDVPLKLDISQLRDPKQARIFELEYLTMPVPYSVVNSGVNFRNRYALRIFRTVIDFYFILRGYTFWRPKSLSSEPHTNRGSKIILTGGRFDPDVVGFGSVGIMFKSFRIPMMITRRRF